MFERASRGLVALCVVTPLPVAAHAQQVSPAPTSLDDYVGRYELTATFHLTVTREGRAIYLQATGQPRAQLHDHARRLDSRIRAPTPLGAADTETTRRDTGREPLERPKRAVQPAMLVMAIAHTVESPANANKDAVLQSKRAAVLSGSRVVVLREDAPGQNGIAVGVP